MFPRMVVVSIPVCSLSPVLEQACRRAQDLARELLLSAWARVPVLTLGLVAFCWGVFQLSLSHRLLSCSGDDLAAEQISRVSSYPHYFSDYRFEDRLKCWPLPEGLLRGQLWRLVTPMAVHMNLMHLVENMFYVLLFGAEVERSDGRLRLLMLVLGFQVWTIGVEISFGLSGTPIIGMGSSGVAYGLGGYFAARRWLDGAFAKSTWRIIGWYAMAMPLMGVRGREFALVVHLGSYAVGAVSGAAQSWLRRSQRAESIAIQRASACK